MANNPKILLCCPTAEVKDYCMKQWTYHIKNYSYTNYDILIIDNSENPDYYKKIQAQLHDFKKGKAEVIHYRPEHSSNRELVTSCQNKMRSYFLIGGYDFMFSNESDIFAPINIMEYLLWHRRKIVGLGYFIGHVFQSKYLIQQMDDVLLLKAQSMLPPLNSCFNWFDGKIKTCFNFGMGCLLIHRSILEKISFRIEPDDPAKGHSDIYFHNDLRTNEIVAFIDTAYVAEHRNGDWGKIKNI